MSTTDPTLPGLQVQGSLAALWISSILLFALVGSVMAILVRGRLWQESRDTVVEFVAVDCAFSVYAGWITAASIVNVVRTPNPIVLLTWRPLRSQLAS